MTKLIRNNELVTPDFNMHEDGETRHRIVSLADFLELENRTDTGVWLDSHEEVEAIAEFLDGIPVIALNFPAFTDGRAYSSANILRRVLGYQGEIRAIGDVRVDQLEQMSRCGFNGFEIGADQDTEKAMSILLSGFSHSYQATTDQQALFDKRAA